LIDPGADPDKLQTMLGNSKPTAILLTHTHLDHIGALAEMRLRLDVPLLAHAGPHFNGLDLDVDRHLGIGDTVRTGHFQLSVQHTPGHIDDQICFLLDDDNRIIVGDTIFEGGPGKTWTAAGFETTIETLRDVVLSWPDDVTCYPGHGPSFVLGQQRAAIEAFVNKEHGAFFGDATWDM
jgi:glyoxylase-like metal-dependent hydrolase (beta-lactamase superfamily II)